MSKKENIIKLNKEQMDAVKYNSGPLRILAGPGSGKTRTIVEKVIEIIENKPDSLDEILLITFTSNSAKEMRERLSKNGMKINGIFTYHAFCNWFIKREMEFSGIDNSWTLIKNIYNEIEKIINSNGKYSELKTSSVVLAISNYVNNCGKKDFDDKEIKEIYKKYQAIKKENKWFDFNDMLWLTWKILKDNKEVSKKYSNIFKFILVDEFQDTNKIQYEIIKHITTKNSLLTVVGDIDQNIYSWRGANAKIMLNYLREDFPKLKTIELKTNYRSVPGVVKLANDLIVNNEFRESSFKSKPFRKQSGLQEYKKYRDKEEELEGIVKIIKKQIKAGTNYNDMAIIVRSASYTFDIKTILEKNNIPSNAIGVQDFLKRKEIIDATIFLMLLLNISDEKLLIKTMRMGIKGVGPKSIEKYVSGARENNSTLIKYLFENHRSIEEKVGKFIYYLVYFAKEIMIPSTEEIEIMSNSLLNFLKKINYVKETKENEHIIENLKEFASVVESNEMALVYLKDEYKIKDGKIFFENEESRNHYIKMRKVEINNFLKNITDSDSNYREASQEITILTAHASKGVEYETVFIPSFIEGHWPSGLAKGQEEMEEERRVAYVAVTRAKTNLFISQIERKFDDTWRNADPSRFAVEMSLVKKENTMPCPECVRGKIIKKKNRYGNFFYACNQWPNCDAVVSEETFLDITDD